MRGQAMEDAAAGLFANGRLWFEEALGLIQGHIVTTDCPRSQSLSQAVGGDVFLKLENQQITGSFKLRGVTHKLFSLAEVDRNKLLIAASTGNHGAAFAYMINKLGLAGKLFVPSTISQVKLAAIQASGIAFECVGHDCVETECHAAHMAEPGALIAPYNDPAIILGQGTIGVELLDQLGHVEAVLVPVGGGGLISGIAAYLAHAAPHVRVIGCQPTGWPVMYHSLEAGVLLEMNGPPTLSDATAGGIEPGSITFDFCKAYVDDFLLVDEDEIMAAIQWVWRHEGLVVEGGAALTVAALLKHGKQFAGRRVALILSGGKLDVHIMKELGVGHD